MFLYWLAIRYYLDQKDPVNWFAQYGDYMVTETQWLLGSFLWEELRRSTILLDNFIIRAQKAFQCDYHISVNNTFAKGHVLVFSKMFLHVCV